MATVVASARISPAVDLPSWLLRAAMLRARPRMSEARASKLRWRSSTVVPPRPAAAWRNCSMSACTGSSQERVMPSRNVVTESRTLRRAL
jgi:hypothetical protein